MACPPHNLLGVNVPWLGFENTGSCKVRLAKISSHLYLRDYGQKVKLSPRQVLNVLTTKSGEATEILNMTYSEEMDRALHLCNPHSPHTLQGTRWREKIQGEGTERHETWCDKSKARGRVESRAGGWKQSWVESFTESCEVRNCNRQGRRSTEGEKAHRASQMSYHLRGWYRLQASQTGSVLAAVVLT